MSLNPAGGFTFYTSPNIFKSYILFNIVKLQNSKPVNIQTELVGETNIKQTFLVLENNDTNQNREDILLFVERVWIAN